MRYGAVTYVPVESSPPSYSGSEASHPSHCQKRMQSLKAHGIRRGSITDVERVREVGARGVEFKVSLASTSVLEFFPPKVTLHLLKESDSAEV